MLELYHAEPIANSVKVLICIFEKGLEFESRYVNLLAFEQHSDEYLAINPNGVVPTLVDGAATITESTIINEYLEDRFPEPPLRPADPAVRAEMRIWIKWLDEYLGPHFSRIGWQMLLHPLARKLGPEEMEKRLARVPLADRLEKWAKCAGDGFTPDELAESRQFLMSGIVRLEKLLDDRAWLFGTDYSLGDIATYAVAGGFPRMMPDLCNADATPNILRWLDAVNARPAVQKALAMPNKVGETLNAAGL